MYNVQLFPLDVALFCDCNYNLIKNNYMKSKFCSGAQVCSVVLSFSSFNFWFYDRPVVFFTISLHHYFVLIKV